MSRWLRYGLLLLGLCGGVGCEGTETGNPDPSNRRDSGPQPGQDAGRPPSLDAGSAYDAGVVPPQDAGKPDDDGGAESER
jgi:hypothetical protein